MTQEELDALLEAGIDPSEIEEEENSEEVSEDDPIIPPPADDKHKVVAQLDEVTKESDEKAVEIMDTLEGLNNDIQTEIEKLSSIKEILQNQKSLFEALVKNFPHIKKFQQALEDIDRAIADIDELLSINEDAEEKIMNAMMIMQYQDIHRQKIERVIHIMRALIRYMNKLFEGKIEDEERVKGADHIHGDESDERVTDDEIEALIEQFGGME